MESHACYIRVVHEGNKWGQSRYPNWTWKSEVELVHERVESFTNGT